MSNNPARLPPLDLLVSFEAVARLGSITRAAHERFITQSAMSRQIAALEADLAVPLFVRRHRALALTDAGTRLLATCTPVLAQLREAVLAVRAPRARALLSLTTTPSFASLWLIPRLTGFTDAHPGVDVRLDASFESRDLAREGFDLAVRYSRAGHSQGECLFGETIVPVCSPALQRRKGAPLRNVADLAGHTLLQVAATPAGGMPLEWESWLQSAGLPRVQPRAMLTFNQYNEAVAAALEGQGVVLGRRPLIDSLLAGQKLVAPFESATATERVYSLIIAPGAQARPAVQALAGWLLSQASPNARKPPRSAATE